MRRDLTSMPAAIPAIANAKSQVICRSIRCLQHPPRAWKRSLRPAQRSRSCCLDCSSVCPPSATAKHGSCRLRGCNEIRSSVCEHGADCAAKSLHRGDCHQCHQHQQQSVFGEVLTFLFLPQLLDYLFHNQSPRSLRKILTTRTDSSRLIQPNFKNAALFLTRWPRRLFTPKNRIFRESLSGRRKNYCSCDGQRAKAWISGTCGVVGSGVDKTLHVEMPSVFIAVIATNATRASNRP